MHLKTNAPFLFYFFILLSFCACSTDLETSASQNLSVLWKLDKNFEYNGSDAHQATFTITNNSSTALKDNWELYWNQSPRGIINIDSSKNVEILRINGDYYRMKPSAGFSLAPNESVEIKLIGHVWMIKEADGPVGVYTVFNPGDNQKIDLVDDFKIAPFENPEQINRNKNDGKAIPTAEQLFEENKDLKLLDKKQLYKAIPTPSSYQSKAGTFSINDGLRITCSETLNSERDLCLASLEQLYGIKATKSDFNNAEIILLLDESLEKAESYQINADDKTISITGKDKAGVFYGIQTFLNIIEEKDNSFFVSACMIEDAPAYTYRGLHVDLARNFQSKETILKMVDILSRYKVNKLVLCLTEDEAWRIEIDGLPELTKVGSRRGHPSKDGSNLQPSYGSGPFIDDQNGSGYYTRADFKEMIKYAKDRHVDIIPLVNFPGHAKAAIESMEYRYRRLMEEGKEEEALKFRLIDPADKSVYLSAQQYNDNIVCVCQKSIYDFYEFVVDDIIEMYEEAEVPLYMFHTGGDEVPRGAWLKSPTCQKNNPEIKTTPEGQAMFLDKMTQRLQGKIDRYGGWEEVVMSYDKDGKWFTNPVFVDRNVYPYIWNNLWGQQDLGYKMANRGYPIILCNVTNFYFDLAYNKDPREPGLYWGGFNNTQDAFSFIPDDLFLSSTEDAMGNKYDQEKGFAGMERLTKEGKDRIIGLQAQLWSETVRGNQMFEYYILPKLFGFAQRSWEGQPKWGNDQNAASRTAAIKADWNGFANTLSQKHFEKIDNLNQGYHYRIPSPGVKIENGKLMMNASFPGMEIRYTVDGENPTAQSKIYEGPVDFTEGVVRAAVFNSKGRSGLTTTFDSEKLKN